MNTDKEKLKKRIRELFFAPDAVVEPTVETVVEEVTAKFLDTKLENGDVIRIEPALEEMATVVLIDETGEVELQPGDYKLEDGTTISVAGGVITAIAAMEEEAAEEVEEENVEMSTEVAPKSTIERTEIETKFTEQAELIAAQSALITELTVKLEGFEVKFSEDLTAVKENTLTAFAEFAEEPAAEPTIKLNTTFGTKKTEKKNSFLGN